MLRRRRIEIVATAAATAVGVAPLLLGLEVTKTRGVLIYLAVLAVAGFLAGSLLARRPTAREAMVVSIVTAVLLAVALLVIADEDILSVLLAPLVAFPPLLVAAAVGYRLFRWTGAVSS